MKSKSLLMIDTLFNAISRLSRSPLNYWAGFAVDIPLGTVLIYISLQSHQLNLITIIPTILLGLLLFSLIEYSFHRWLFHGMVQITAQGHSAHHHSPLGYDSLPFFLPATILLGFTGLFALLMPAMYVFLLMGTITLGYVAYGLSHFVIHHHRFHYVFTRNWAANHYIHHQHPDSNFGVTTPLWDILFRTRYKRTS